MPTSFSYLPTFLLKEEAKGFYRQPITSDVVWLRGKEKAKVLTMLGVHSGWNRSRGKQKWQDFCSPAPDYEGMLLKSQSFSLSSTPKFSLALKHLTCAYGHKERAALCNATALVRLEQVSRLELHSEALQEGFFWLLRGKKRNLQWEQAWKRVSLPQDTASKSDGWAQESCVELLCYLLDPQLILSAKTLLQQNQSDSSTYF